MSAIPALGFIGIGRMGNPMVRRLLAAGRRVLVHDVIAAAAREIVTLGAEWRDSPAAIVQEADIMCTCVPGPNEVRTIMEGPRGTLARPRAGVLIIEMSTIGPAQSRALAACCASADMRYVDAPVSNGVEAAARGALTIMVGGEREDYERAQPVLAHLGDRLYHLGPVGSGNAAKLINQSIYLTYVAAYCEAARMGRDAGLDTAALVDVLRHSVAGAPVMTKWDERLVSGDRIAGFAIDRVLKDLGLAEAMLAEQHAAAPVFAGAIATYRAAAAAGAGTADMTAIFSRD